MARPIATQRRSCDIRGFRRVYLGVVGVVVSATIQNDVLFGSKRKKTRGKLRVEDQRTNPGTKDMPISFLSSGLDLLLHPKRRAERTNCSVGPASGASGARCLKLKGVNDWVTG